METEEKIAIYEDGQQAGEKIATERIVKQLREVFMGDDRGDSYISLAARIALFIRELETKK